MWDEIDRELLRVSGGWLYRDGKKILRLAEDVDWHEPVGRVGCQERFLVRLRGMPDFSGPSALNLDFVAAVLLG
jgi:hypothetical protein